MQDCSKKKSSKLKNTKKQKTKERHGTDENKSHDIVSMSGEKSSCDYFTWAPLARWGCSVLFAW